MTALCLNEAIRIWVEQGIWTHSVIPFWPLRINVTLSCNHSNLFWSQETLICQWWSGAEQAKVTKLAYPKIRWKWNTIFGFSSVPRISYFSFLPDLSLTKNLHHRWLNQCLEGGMEKAYSFPSSLTRASSLAASSRCQLHTNNSNSHKTHVSQAKWSLNTIWLSVFTNEVLISCQLLTGMKGNGLDEEGWVNLS